MVLLHSCQLLPDKEDHQDSSGDASPSTKQLQAGPGDGTGCPNPCSDTAVSEMHLSCSLSWCHVCRGRAPSQRESSAAAGESLPILSVLQQSMCSNTPRMSETLGYRAAARGLA